MTTTSVSPMRRVLIELLRELATGLDHGTEYNGDRALELSAEEQRMNNAAITMVGRLQEAAYALEGDKWARTFCTEAEARRLIAEARAEFFAEAFPVIDTSVKGDKPMTAADVQVLSGFPTLQTGGIIRPRASGRPDA